MIQYFAFRISHAGIASGNFTGTPDIVRFNCGLTKCSDAPKTWKGFYNV